MFLDTSIVVEIFRNEQTSDLFKEIYEYINDEPIFISIIQLGEISDWCLKHHINPNKRIEKLKQIVNLVPLSETICMEGSTIKHTIRKKGVKKFSLIDGMILSSARSINQQLLTRDKDFKSIKNVIVL